MKYASIDIETTGLDSEFCQILSVGVVIEDTKNKLPFEEIPKFHAIILRKRIQGEPFALNMNKDIIEIINSNKEVANIILIKEDELVDHLISFFRMNGLEGKISVAGKNYTGFDKKFLEKIEGWDRLNIHRRVIDPAPLYMDWGNDEELPDLNLCKFRAGISGEVTHDAIEDAWDVIQVLRKKYEN